MPRNVLRVRFLAAGKLLSLALQPSLKLRTQPVFCTNFCDFIACTSQLLKRIVSNNRDEVPLSNWNCGFVAECTNDVAAVSNE